MSIIISLFIRFLNTFNKLIWKFIVFLSKLIKTDELDSISSKPKDVRYRHFKVDKLPIIEPFKKLDKLDSKQLIKVNNIKPVKRHYGKDMSINVSCPRCNASKDYIYDNNGKGSQFKCKVCSHVFSTNPNPFKDIILKCPYCSYQLELYHKREGYNVYRCRNNKCSYYTKNLNSMNTKDTALYLKNPSKLKLRYIYRAFDIEIPSITKDFKEFIRSPIDLSKAHHSFYTIALCLTYHVNYGLSYRQTAAILYDIHQLKISHQTVRNYCDSVAGIVHSVLEYYPYDLSNTIAGDETYINIKGKTNYVFFMFDAIKKIITSYRVFAKRDSISAIKATYSTLRKYSDLPDNLKFITDGNPIYNVAHQYWSQHGKRFDLFQVIGLTNVDDTSKKYRSQKQIIERHNRTFKFYYAPTNGLGSLHNANTYMILFSVCFNFLRPHSALGYKVPQYVKSIDEKTNMPAKWLELINLGYKFTADYN